MPAKQVTYPNDIIDIIDDLPAGRSDGYLIKLETITVSGYKANPVSDICICNGCDYLEKVFSETGAINFGWKNDKTSLLFSKKINTDSIIIKLKCDSLNFNEEITDDTYGKYYSTFSNKPLQLGFVCDWNKVFNSIGGGVFYFEITLNILGEVTILKTINYFLQEYSDLKAEGTVKIESWQTGEIINKPFTYIGLLPDGWYQSIRIEGKLLSKIPTKKQDNYYSTDNKLIQIQDKVEYEYNIESGLLPIEVADLLIEDNLLANKIVVSDYNYFSEANLKEIELDSVDYKKTSFTHNKSSIYTFKMKPRFDNLIKNNF